MSRICWWFVDRVSRGLEPDERDAVLGDVAESGEAACQALRDVLGLVVRRQAALWTDWRPWLTLVGLIVPLGMLLSIASRTTADDSAVYFWMYAHWWNWAFLGNPGFRTDLAHNLALFLVEYMTLACCSWTSGFVLGSVSHRISQVNGVLFCIMLFLGAVLGAPQYLSYYHHYVQAKLHLSPLPDQTGPVFAENFYSAIFPLIVQAALVAIPSLWGIRQGLHTAERPVLLRTTLWIAAIASMAALTVQQPGFVLFFEEYRRPAGILVMTFPSKEYDVLKRLLQPVLFWPVVYEAAAAVKRRWAAP